MKSILMRAGLTLAVLMGVFTATMGTVSASPDPQVYECVTTYYGVVVCGEEAGAYNGYVAALPFPVSYLAYPSYYVTSYPYVRPFAYRGITHHFNGGHRGWDRGWERGRR